MKGQDSALLSSFFTSVLRAAETQGANFIVLSGLDDGHLSFDSSDVDVLCETRNDVNKILNASIKVLKSQPFEDSIRILNLQQHKNGFRLVVCDSSKELKIHMLDCFHEYAYENIQLVSGKAYFELSKNWQNIAELINVIKQYNKSKTRWPQAPSEIIALTYTKVSALTKIQFYISKITRLLYGYFGRRRGLWIALLGIDGSGKSSLIKGLKEIFDADRSLIPLYYFHWRPPLSFSRTPRQSNSGLLYPHTQKPRSKIQSAVKIPYLVLRYLLGYILNIRPLLVRQGVVVADRYYHDILVDPHRYRYGASMSLARIATRFVPQPDVFIILDLPHDIAHTRKPEVALEKAAELRDGYLRLARSLPNAIVIDARKSQDSVVAEVARIIAAKLSEQHNQVVTTK